MDFGHFRLCLMRFQEIVDVEKVPLLFTRDVEHLWRIFVGAFLLADDGIDTLMKKGLRYGLKRE